MNTEGPLLSLVKNIILPLIFVLAPLDDSPSYLNGGASHIVIRRCQVVQMSHLSHVCSECGSCAHVLCVLVRGSGVRMGCNGKILSDIGADWLHSLCRLLDRYEGLKEEGKLHRFMEKKRKKNAAKDHRWLPNKRQDRG